MGDEGTRVVCFERWSSKNLTWVTGFSDKSLSGHEVRTKL